MRSKTQTAAEFLRIEFDRSSDTMLSADELLTSYTAYLRRKGWFKNSTKTSFFLAGGLARLCKEGYIESVDADHWRRADDR